MCGLLNIPVDLRYRELAGTDVASQGDDKTRIMRWQDRVLLAPM
jgi:hypothetical protein